MTDEKSAWHGKTIAVLGLAFKPNTDDMRAAPSITIISQLQKNGAKIRAFDPEAMGEAKTELEDVEYAKNAYDCVDGADALVIVTEWDQFRALDMAKVKALLKEPNVVDLRNIYTSDVLEDMGINYTSVGR